jgi:hypothetical protein
VAFRLHFCITAFHLSRWRGRRTFTGFPKEAKNVPFGSPGASPLVAGPTSKVSTSQKNCRALEHKIWAYRGRRFLLLPGVVLGAPPLSFFAVYRRATRWRQIEPSSKLINNNNNNNTLGQKGQSPTHKAAGAASSQQLSWVAPPAFFGTEFEEQKRKKKKKFSRHSY